MLLILPVEGGHVTRILSHRELALVFENTKMEQDEIKKTVTELVSWVTFYRSVIGTFLYLNLVIYSSFCGDLPFCNQPLSSLLQELRIQI